MMKRLFGFTTPLAKLCKWAIFAAVLILVLLGLGIAALATSIYVSQRDGQLQQWLSDRLGSQVSFDVAELHWQGIEPGLALHNIRITPADAAHSVLKVNTAIVDFSIFKSIRQLNLVTQKIMLSGLKLTLIESADGHYQLQGFSGDSSSGSGQLFLDWLQKQSQIQLNDVRVHVNQLQGTILIDDLALTWEQTESGHFALMLSADLPQTIGGYVNVQGNLQSVAGQLQGQLYFDVQGADFSYLLHEFSWQGLTLQSIGGEASGWVSWQQQLTSVKTKLLLHHVVVANAAQKTVLEPRVALMASWQPSGAGWQLTVEPVEDGVNSFADESVPVDYWQITQQTVGQAEQWQVQGHQLNLAKLSPYAGLLDPKAVPVAAVIAGVNPQGSLQNIYASWQQQNGTISAPVVDLDLNNVATTPWQQYPGIQGLSGHVHVTSQWGAVELSSPHFRVNAPMIFNLPWPESQLNTTVFWQKNQTGWNVQLSRFYLSNAWESVFASGNVQIPNDTHKPVLNILGGVVLHHAEQMMPYYLPSESVLAAKARSWLSANIQQAPDVVGSFVFHGPAQYLPFANHQGMMQIVANVKNATVVPWYGWPSVAAVNGHLLFNNASMEITANTGVIPGASVNRFSLMLDNMTKGVASDYHINIAATIHNQDVKQYIDQSPLADSIGDLLQVLDIQGSMKLSLGMLFPSGPGSDQKPDQINGEVILKDNDIQLQGTPLVAQKISGVVHFDQTKVSANNIQGLFFGEPLKVVLATVTDKANTKRVVTLWGTLDPQALTKQFHLSMNSSLIKGRAPFVSHIVVNSTGKVLVNIASSLQGIAIGLPAPLSKSATMIAPLEVSADFTHVNKVPIRGHIGHILATQLLLQIDHQKIQSLQGVVTLGLAKALMTDVPSGNGVWVNGMIPYLSLNAWIDKLTAAFPSSTSGETSTVNDASLSQWFKGAELKFATLNAFSQQFQQLLVKLYWQSPNWKVSVAGPKASGVLTLPTNWQKPFYQGQFDYLFFANRPATGGVVQVLSARDLLAWPAMNMSVKQFYWGTDSFGQVQLVTQPVSNGIQISNLQVTTPVFSGSVNGTIVAQNKTNSFNFSGKITSQDWGTMLTEMGYPDIINKGNGTFEFSGTWLGDFTTPVISSIQGHLSFDLKKGEISKINPGMARYLGLFSVSSLMRRLSFNFSDVTDKGLAFDTLTGDYVIKNGVASTKETALTGPSLDLVMKGDVDMVHQQLNQTVVVIPQIGSGLALAVGLVATPIAGAAVWIADKVLSNTVLKNKGLEYQVTGPWDNPQVTSLLQGASS